MMVYPFPNEVIGCPWAYIFYVVTTFPESEDHLQEPRYISNQSAVLETTRRSLEIARNIGLESISFPLLGTGKGNLDIGISSGAMHYAICKHFRHKTSLKRVGLLVPDRDKYKKVKNILDEKFRT